MIRDLFFSGRGVTNQEENFMRGILLILISCSLSFNTFASPAGDLAVIDLAMANVACSAIQNINPDAVNSTYANFFNDSVRLYQLFHNVSKKKAEAIQYGFYGILTSESTIKAQSLNSIVGAQRYLSQYLVKTDANSCDELKKVADIVLSNYNEKL